LNQAFREIMGAAVRELKRRARKIGWLYDLVRARRARRQEAEYIYLRENHYRKTGTVFSEPGWQARASQLLQMGWTRRGPLKESPDRVRIFLAATDDLGGPRILPSFQRHFETTVFDLRRFRHLDPGGEAERAIDKLDSWRPHLQQELLKDFFRAHAARPVDLVFAYGSHLDFEHDTLKKIRSSGVPVALLCLDDKHIFRAKNYGYPNGQQPLIGAADVHVTNSLECVRWYVAHGVAGYFMPQGIDPEIFKPLQIAKDLDVSFIGQRYGGRGRLVDTLRACDIRVTCFGAGWGTRGISESEKVEIYNRSRVNLGIGGTGLSNKITCIKGRDFEVPSCGSLYLTTYNHELTGMFAIGGEILCYHNEIDCAEIIRYCLERPEEAAAIGRAARQRCLKDHTWQGRIAGLLEWMGICKK
jgi:spore maturation protein CgeB